MGDRNTQMKRSTDVPGTGSALGCRRETEAVQLGTKGGHIGLMACVGGVLLTALILGGLDRPQDNASRQGLAARDQPFRKPMPAVEPDKPPSAGGPPASTLPQGKSDPAGPPAGTSGRNTLVTDRSGMFHRLETLHRHSRNDGKSRRPVAATTPPKTHPGRRYAALLWLLAGRRY